MSSAAAWCIPTLTAREFDQIRGLVYDKFGLDLRPGKEPLVSARLAKHLRELQMRSFDEYYRHVVGDRSGASLTALIDALTTNHTCFYRESGHFDFLRQTIIPGLRRDRLAIWSAACSTGEEPYSIAFSALEALGQRALATTRILATDISTRVLDIAREGVYDAERLHPVPIEHRSRYLLRVEGRPQSRYKVKPEVRSMIDFRRLNLMERVSHVGRFDVIFCRNVMIYFDPPTQRGVVNRLAGCLEPGGYLLIGHAESLNSVDHALQYVRPAVFRKPQAKFGADGRRSS